MKSWTPWASASSLINHCPALPCTELHSHFALVMAASLLSCVFQRLRPSRLGHLNSSSSSSHHSTSQSFTVPSNQATVPINPASDNILLPQAPSNDSTNTLLLLNAMADQGSPTLAVVGVVFDSTTSLADIGREFAESEGYIGVGIARTYMDTANRMVQDCRFEFKTAADASRALHLHPQLVIARRAYLVTPYHGLYDEPESSLAEPPGSAHEPAQPPVISPPPLKRVKKEDPRPLCKICFDELDGPFSTPCRRCQAARCYDCLKKTFQVALQDMNRMPVTCCGAVMHFDVARGILSEEELTQYKMKYDEFVTADPLYCPVPTCSTFIPPRIFHSESARVTCHACKVVICTKCKQLSTPRHVCSQDKPRQFILETFHYKICPKCGTGVMKMFGCPHVRCQCGAHWCWDCQRPMNICYRKPCQSARDDGENSVQGDESESERDDPGGLLEENGLETREGEQGLSEDRTVLPDEPVTSTLETATDQPVQAESSMLVPSTEAEPLEASTESEVQPAIDVIPTTETDTSRPAAAVLNLDDPLQIEWENQSVDFGDEPADEGWDIWGCRHRFKTFIGSDPPRFWLVDVDTTNDTDFEIECMACFNKIKLWRDEAEVKVGQDGSGNTNRPANHKVSRLQNRQTTKTSKGRYAFECRLCGVVYCRPCKKAANKQVQTEWERVAPRTGE